MHDFYVYRWFHLESGKSYVGKGRLKRAVSHKYSAFKGKNFCPKLYRAMRKHGLAAFSWEYLAQGLDEDLAFELEKTAIVAYNCRGDGGYNVTAGGEGPKHEPEAKEKIAAWHRGRKYSPEHVANMSKARLGIPCSEAAKEASRARKGYKRTAESVAKTAAGHRGQKRSATTRARISDAISALSDVQTASVRMLLALGALQKDVAVWFGVHHAVIARRRGNAAPKTRGRRIVFTPAHAANVAFLSRMGATLRQLREWFPVRGDTIRAAIRGGL